MQFLRKLHKWLGLIIGLQLVLWAVSGLMFADDAADLAGVGRVWWLPTLEQAAEALAPRLGQGDLLITIGAEDITKLADALVDGGRPG